MLARHSFGEGGEECLACRSFCVNGEESLQIEHRRGDRIISGGVKSSELTIKILQSTIL